MILPPPLRKQNEIMEIATSSATYKCRLGNAVRSRSKYENVYLSRYEHGNESKKKTKNNDQYYPNHKLIEGPIDLSASNSLKRETELEFAEEIKQAEYKTEEDLLEKKVKVQKNKQKKRKISHVVIDEDWAIEHSNERFPKQTVNKREEVLKAAKSLFSKRTRTLYHWMYPDTSKGKLKAIVSSAWDTLSNTEKEFYISQVLGRFGVPAGSLMVNPQLGGFQNRELLVPSTLGILASTANVSIDDFNQTTRQLSSNNADDDPTMWSKKRWHKNISEEISSPRQNYQHSTATPAIDSSVDDDEFADDPELTTELMQFQRALGSAE